MEYLSLLPYDLGQFSRQKPVCRIDKAKSRVLLSSIKLKVMSKFIGIDISKNKFSGAFVKENKKWEQKKRDYTSDGILHIYETLPVGDRVFIM